MPAKTASKKAAPKKTVKAAAKPAVKKAEPKKKNESVFSKGAKLACKVCGLAVTVNHACGCTEVSKLICCGKPMQIKK